jgi:hypothetical protein
MRTYFILSIDKHRWRADNQKVGGRRTREKVDEVKDGRVRRLNSQRVLLTPYCQKNHTTRVKRPFGLWSRPQRGQGGGKGAEAQNVPGLRTFRREVPFTCLLPVSGYGSDRVGVEQHYVPTRVSPTHPAAETTEATNRTNSNRQRSKLAEEVRKVKRVEESEKWVTRPRGGRSKTKTLEQSKMIGATVE